MGRSGCVGGVGGEEGMSACELEGVVVVVVGGIDGVQGWWAGVGSGDLVVGWSEWAVWVVGVSVVGVGYGLRCWMGGYAGRLAERDDGTVVLAVGRGGYACGGWAEGMGLCVGLEPKASVNEVC